MFLIGQYDSPFVRRVAIAMRLYGIGFEHKPWSTFGDAEKIAPYNPLGGCRRWCSTPARR
jgi:glutathione S-transferase